MGDNRRDISFTTLWGTTPTGLLTLKCCFSHFGRNPCPPIGWVPPAGSFLSRQEAPQECGLREALSAKPPSLKNSSRPQNQQGLCLRSLPGVLTAVQPRKVKNFCRRGRAFSARKPTGDIRSFFRHSVNAHCCWLQVVYSAKGTKAMGTTLEFRSSSSASALAVSSGVMESVSQVSVVA